jgi:hypothetical protein
MTDGIKGPTRIEVAMAMIRQRMEKAPGTRLPSIRGLAEQLACPNPRSSVPMTAVLHIFQKKSKRGITTPREDMSIVRQRLKVATAVALELRDEKASR